MLRLEIPMIVELEDAGAFLKIRTPLGPVRLDVRATDADKDGDPEVELEIDAPFDLLDTKIKGEVPIATLLGPIAGTAAFLLDGQTGLAIGMIADIVEALVKKTVGG